MNLAPQSTNTSYQTSALRRAHLQLHSDKPESPSSQSFFDLGLHLFQRRTRQDHRIAWQLKTQISMYREPSATALPSIPEHVLELVIKR